MKDAERALGTKLEPRSIVYTSDECYQTSRADKKDPGIGYVIESGKISVINVFSSDGQTPDVIDKHRLGIGETEDDIRRAYGQVKKMLGFYDRGEPEPDPNKPQRGADTGRHPRPNTFRNSGSRRKAPTTSAPFSSSRGPARLRR